MATWRLAKSLETLRAQVNGLVPLRSKVNDGTIGDSAHASRTSDHNPNSDGVVCALDLTHDPKGGFDSYIFAELLRNRRDPRIKYVISNRRIFYGPRSPTFGNRPDQLWKWQPYSGSNPHDQHVHISVADPKWYDRSSPWDITGTDTVPPDPVAEAVADFPVLRRGATGSEVRTLQSTLGLDVDGTFGVETEAAVRTFQADHGLTPDGVVGSYTWRELIKQAAAPMPPAATALPRPTVPAAAEPTWWESLLQWLFPPRPPTPAPKPVPAPPPVAKPPGVQRNITATIFASQDDPQTSAYTGLPIRPGDPGVALPWRFTGTRPQVKLVNPANGKSTIVPILDVGPWLTDDPYWTTGRRPLAESKTPLPRGPNKGQIANGAGIDLTPATARAIGVSGDPRRSLVDWELV